MSDRKPTYCAWDGVDLAGRHHSRLIDVEWQGRQRRRLAFLEHWVGVSTAAMAAEQNERLQYWLAPPVQEVRASRNVGCGLAVASLLAYVGVRAAIYYGFWFVVEHPLVFLGLLCACVVVVLPFVSRNHRREATLAPLRQDVCGTCGYDLTGRASHAVAAEMVRLGPPVCPECGAPWPFVPPPVPDSARAQPRDAPTNRNSAGA